MRGIDGAFVTPDTDQFLQSGAQHIGVIIARAVIAVRHEDEARVMQQAIMFAPIAAEGARHGDIGFEFVIDEAFDLGIAGLAQPTGEVAGGAGRQHDRPRQRQLIAGEGCQHIVHDDMIMARKMRNADTRRAGQHQRGILGGGLGVKAEQHFGTAIGLDPGNGDGIIDL